MVNSYSVLFTIVNLLSITIIHNSYINILSKENEISQLIFKGVNKIRLIFKRIKIHKK